MLSSSNSMHVSVGGNCTMNYATISELDVSMAKCEVFLSSKDIE